MTPLQTTGKVSGSSVSSITCTLTSVTQNSLLVCCVSGGTATTNAGFDVPAGWLVAENPAAINRGDGPYITSSIFYKELSASGTNTCTLNFAGSPANSWFIANMTEWPITAAYVLDKHTNKNGTAATSATIGPTGITTAAAEIVLAICGIDGAGSVTALSDPPSSGYTSLASEPTNSTTASDIGYLSPSSVGAQTASWTWTGSGTYVTSIATFRQAAAPQVVVQPPIIYIGASSGTADDSITVADGDTIIAIATHDDGDHAVTISISDGVGYTPIVGNNTTNRYPNVRYTQISIRQNLTRGTYNVSASPSGTEGNRSLQLIKIGHIGAFDTTPAGNYQVDFSSNLAGTGADAVVSSSITPASVNCLLLGISMVDPTTNPFVGSDWAHPTADILTAGTSWTMGGAATLTQAVAYRTVPSVTSYQAKFTQATTNTGRDTYVLSFLPFTLSTTGALVGQGSTIAGSSAVTTVPQFTVHPTVQIAAEGTLATFTGTATNAVSYQWYVDIGQGAGPTSISGATSTTYITPFLFRSIHAGWIYTLRATNTIGTSTSNSALLQVTNIPASSAGGFVIGDSFTGEGQIGSTAIESHTAAGPLVGQGSTVAGSAARAAGGGAVTHATTGALVGQGSTVVGTAVYNAKHTTTGALVGQGSTVAGTAARFRAMATTGALVGQGSTVAGSAVYNAKHTTTGALVGQGSTVAGSAVYNAKHTTTGALVGQGSTVAGTAARFRAMATTGALVGQGSTVAGTAVYNAKHTTTGALVGQGSTVAGTAARFRAMATTGALVGQGSTVAGTAVYNAKHTTTGALVGQGSTVAGSAVYNAKHTTTGALVGQGSTVAGTAARFRAMTTTGALVGQGSTVAGTAARSAGASTHNSSGALVGQSSTIVGSAARFRAMATSGNLAGQGSIIACSAIYNAKHATSGALVGPGTIIVSSATRFRVMATSGILTGVGALVSGSATRFRAMATSGVLVGPGSTLAGNAQRFRTFTSSGNLVGAGSLISGSAIHRVLHATTAILIGSGSSISGSVNRFRVFSTSGILSGAGAIISGLANHPLKITDYTGEVFIRNEIVNYYYKNVLVNSYATSDKIDYHYVTTNTPLISTKVDPQYYYRTENVPIFITNSV